MLVTVPLFHLLLLIFRHTFITHSNLCAIIRSIWRNKKKFKCKNCLEYIPWLAILSFLVRMFFLIKNMEYFFNIIIKFDLRKEIRNFLDSIE